LLDGDAADAVAALKAEPGAGPRRPRQRTLVRALMARGLVDELVLTIHPLALGGGLRLFDGLGAPVPLELVACVPDHHGRSSSPRTGPRPRRRVPMKRYLLSIIQPDGGPPPPAVLERVMTDLDALNSEIRAAGAWVFSGGLHPPASATVVRVQDGELLMLDGPFAEAKEHLGGLWIIEAPDLDAALGWARRAAEATTLPIEVRPFREA
jgi:hypothetical protein